MTAYPGPDGAAWPGLRVASWTDTRATLHMWLQIIGKIRMTETPLVNHWWNVTFYVSPRGLRTGTMPYRARAFDAEFDFIDHVLVFRTSDGRRDTVALRPRTVADFYQDVTGTLARLDIDAKISPRPNEVSPAIPFEEDTEHHSYDAEAARLFWEQLVQADRVFQLWRAGFAGKSSPVHVFWGAMDLACTRFSGRAAPPHPGGAPNCAVWVNEEAYSRECASAGFWPGGGEEGAFYAYCYPVPDCYAGQPAGPEGAHWDSSLGEFVLPYEAVRQSADPGATLLRFLNATYAAAADLAHWDRGLLDVDPRRLDGFIKAEPRTDI